MVLEEKGKFDKGKQKFSKSLYTIDKREGYKLIIKDEKRKLKPSELLKTTTVSNPISQAYIDRTIKSKEIAKKDINKDELISMNDVEINWNKEVLKAREYQKNLIVNE